MPRNETSARSIQRPERPRAVSDPMSGPTASVEHMVYTDTHDGLNLRGLMITPTRPVNDAPLLLWLHTRQQSFAEPEYVTIGRLMAAQGVPFLTVDTRGHDFGAWFRTAHGPVLSGSAWERFTDCIHDLDAWIDLALRSGHKRIVLAGHGFGGGKVLHYMAQRRRAEVPAIVLASSGSAVRDKYRDESTALAAGMVAEGRGRDLMPWGTGGDSTHATVSADWFMARARMHRELFGDSSMPPAIARVTCPVIAWFGEEEETKGREVSDFLDWLRANAVSAPVFEGHLLRGVPFYYRGKEPEIVRVLTSGLRRLRLLGPRSARAGLE